MLDYELIKHPTSKIKHQTLLIILSVIQSL